MPYFTWAESYANEGEQRIFSSAFDSAREVQCLNLAFSQLTADFTIVLTMSGWLTDWPVSSWPPGWPVNWWSIQKVITHQLINWLAKWTIIWSVSNQLINEQSTDQQAIQRGSTDSKCWNGAELLLIIIVISNNLFSYTVELMHIIFCLNIFISEWGISTDDCLTIWQVGSGASTPEVSC